MMFGRNLFSKTFSWDEVEVSQCDGISWCWASEWWFYTLSSPVWRWWLIWWSNQYERCILLSSFQFSFRDEDVAAQPFRHLLISRLSQTVLHSCVDKLGALILRRPSGSSCDLCSLVTTGVIFFCQYWSFCCLFMHDLLNVSWMNKNSKLWASISSDCHGLFWFSI